MSSGRVPRRSCTSAAWFTLRATALVGIAAVIGVFLPGANALADPSTDEILKRLDQVQSEVDSLRRANEETRRNQAGAGVITVKPNGREASISFGGIVQAEGDFGDKGDVRFTTDDDRFFLRRARMNASGKFLEDYDFKVELDLAGSLGQTTGLRAQMTDGYVSWMRFPSFTVRAGQFKTPYGYEQLCLDSRIFTIERSLGNDRLTLSRQVGLQFSGDLREKRVSYAAGLWNGTGTNTNTNDDDNFLYVGRLSGIPFQKVGKDIRWSVGGGAYASHDHGVTIADFSFDATPADKKPDNVFAGEKVGVSLDTEVHYGRFETWFEYLGARFDPDNGVPLDRLQAASGIAQAMFFVVAKRLQAVVKYDFYDPTRGRGDDTVETITLGINNFVKGDDLKLQLNELLVKTPGKDDQRKTFARIQAVF